MNTSESNEIQRGRGRVRARGTGSSSSRGARARRGGRRVRPRGGSNRGRDRDNSESFNAAITGFTEGDEDVSGPNFDVPFETPLHQKRRRLWMPSTPVVKSRNSSTVSAPALTEKPSASHKAPPPTSEALFKNYGSDDDSDDDNDMEDCSFPAFVPRTQRFLFEDFEDVAPLEQTLQFEPLPTEWTPVVEPVAPKHKPRSMLDFEWRDFPNPPVPLTERREVFSEINCGPTAPFLTPYDAFIAIWSRDLMEYIVSETNRYAQQVAEKQLQEGSLKPGSRIKKWYDTDVNELYVYFGLLLAMGLVVKGDLKEYWSNDEIISTPCYGRYMSLNRFLLLSRCLHFNNNTTDLLTMTRPQAKIYKIAPIITHLNLKFQSLYRLGRNIVIDESLTQWKGRLDIKQYIRPKTASVGIKMYEVCESQTGYSWRYKAYAGREEVTQNESWPVTGVTATLVLELLKGLENKGHTVWMDNCYNNPALARVLKSIGFDCVGTLKSNPQCAPTCLATLKKSDMALGQISGCTSGDVDVLVWRDHTRVSMISTYHGASVHTANGKTKPIAIHDYNVCMGGVDKKDQMLSAYPMERKRTQVWYKKLFRRLLNTSVLNAYILHKHSPIPDKHAHIIRHREFRKTLIRQIFSKHYVPNFVPKRSTGANSLGQLHTEHVAPLSDGI